jgi:hypothetical protein
MRSGRRPAHCEQCGGGTATNAIRAAQTGFARAHHVPDQYRRCAKTLLFKRRGVLVFARPRSLRACERAHAAVSSRFVAPEMAGPRSSLKVRLHSAECPVSGRAFIAHRCTHFFLAASCLRRAHRQLPSNGCRSQSRRYKSNVRSIGEPHISTLDIAPRLRDFSPLGLAREDAGVMLGCSASFTSTS